MSRADEPDGSAAGIPADSGGQPRGYTELVRGNQAFRRLWLGSIVSLLGDWFNTIALYALILQLSGSAVALGAIFLTKMVPWAIASPVAGLIVDRFDRRRLMIGADLLRAVVVLGFLLVDEPSEIPLIYVLSAAQVMLGAVFQPAQSASLPNIVPAGSLVTANALMAATWSTILAVGAALGGFATEWLGIRAVFLIDSASYLVSAWFILRIRIPQNTDARTPVTMRSVGREIAEGWVHMRRVPSIGRMALAKASWAAGGGALVYMLTLLGESMSPDHPSIAIGVLFSARGLGTGIGPIVVRALATDRARWPALLGGCVMFSGVSYVVVGLVGPVWWIAGLVLLAHSTSGANWVLSNVLLQERTEDRWRGRVFATEWLILMAVESVSILVASLLLESGQAHLATVVLLFSGIQIATGLAWLVFVVPAER